MSLEGTENTNINVNGNSYEVEINSMISSFVSLGFNGYHETSLEEVNMYLKNPMYYNREIRMLVKQFYNSNGLMSNVIDYLISLPTLNKMSTNATGLKIDKEIVSKRKKIDILAETVGHKSTTRDIMRLNYLDGLYVGILRDTNDTVKPLLSMYDVQSIDEIDALNIGKSVMIQPLNPDYVKVIGLNGSTYISAFDMQYFDLFKYGGLVSEIRNYPKDFVKAYKDYKKDGNKRWHRLDPNTTITVKFKSSKKEPYGRPYAISALREMIFSKEYEDDQFGLIRELASSIYTMELPEGEHKGKCSLTKDQQTALITEYESAILSNVDGSGKKISTLTLPPNTKINRITKDNSLVKDTLAEENTIKISTALGFASSALNAVSEGGASYASLAVNIDLISSQIYELLDEISSEYSRVFNYYLFGKTYPDIKFEYLHMTELNKDKIFEKAKDLYVSGAGSRRYMIESAGFDSNAYMSAMDEELFEKFDEKYKPHATSFNSSGDSNDKGGRKEKPVFDLTNPSSVSTKGNGLNIRG